MVPRQGLGKRHHRLALTAENQCVFCPTAQGRCRIHEHARRGGQAAALPDVPFSVVAAWTATPFVTLRCHCPSAAAEQGHSLEANNWRRSAIWPPNGRPTRGQPARRRLWPGTTLSGRTSSASPKPSERLVLDQRFPLVRRLAHGLKLCDLLERCRVQNFSGRGWTNCW